MSEVVPEIDRQAKDLTDGKLEFYLGIAKGGLDLGKFTVFSGRLMKSLGIPVGITASLAEGFQNGFGVNSASCLAIGGAAILGGHVLDKIGRYSIVVHGTTKQYLEREKYLRTNDHYQELTAGDPFTTDDPIIDYFRQNPIDTRILE